MIRSLFRKSPGLMHFSNDLWDRVQPSPVKAAPAFISNGKIFDLNMTGDRFQPFNNRFGHKAMYRGGEMWRIVDAKGMEIEALAELLVIYLMGRHRHDWRREQSMGDQIIVVNCRHVAMDDNEGTPLPWRMKPYSYKTGYPRAWGIQMRRADEEYLIDPCRPLWLAVKERLPRRHPANRGVKRKSFWGRSWIEKLHCFPDEEHPFKAKRPLPLVFPIEGTGAEQYQGYRTNTDIPHRMKPQGHLY
eukprot:TRINITY_DN4328_c1_g1_i1.p1 TRINITY_DN4328_c1_g1~~TRINITY_DN4328_c1_g1_i1.p1  ORF type:complete len:245 (+),score=6.38 TRINITY_DN4328_c1_g1_i1:100-834(+)